MRTESIVTTCVSRAVGECLPTLFLFISIRMTGNPPHRIFIQMNELPYPARNGVYSLQQISKASFFR